MDSGAGILAVIVGFAFAFGLVGVFVHHLNARDAEREERVRQATTEAVWAETDVVDACLGRHVGAIKMRLRRVIFPNEYGVWSEAALDKEIAYFLDNVVVPECELVIAHRRPYWLAVVGSAFQEFMEEERDASSPALTRNDGLAYERNVAAEFARLGFAITYTPRSGDQGVDIIASRDGTMLAIQCKDYTGSVGNDAVQQAYTGSAFYRANEAIVVSPAPFTASARALAHQLKVTLLHQDDITHRFAPDGSSAKAAKHHDR